MSNIKKTLTDFTPNSNIRKLPGDIAMLHFPQTVLRSSMGVLLTSAEANLLITFCVMQVMAEVNSNQSCFGKESSQA